MYNSRTINSELKALVAAFRNSYQEHCKRSRDAYMGTLHAGAAIPPADHLYPGDEKTEFENECVGFRQKANDIISSALEDISVKKSEAPTPEAVSVLQLLSLRKGSISGEEIQNLADRYGDNYQVCKTLVSIALEHDLNEFAFATIGLDDKEENIENLGKQLNNNLTISTAMSRNTDAYWALVNMYIDQAFPVDGTN